MEKEEQEDSKAINKSLIEFIFEGGRKIHAGGGAQD
jgi:hypothetical protein